jgi:hypothetical protein
MFSFGSVIEPTPGSAYGNDPGFSIFVLNLNR